VSADVSGNLASAGGVSNVNRIPQVELFDECCEVIGVGVHVVAVPGLHRPSMTAPVVGDCPIAVRGKEEHFGRPTHRH